MEKNNILIVDDDPQILRLLEKYLGTAGYDIQCASDGDEMYASIKKQDPDLILLDLRLPGVQGIDLLRGLRQHMDVGVIIMTGSGEDVDRIVGLEVGADDYVEKPFDTRELLARVRSVLRRYHHNQTEDNNDRSIARFGDYTLDQTGHCLKDSNANIIELTAHEYLLLNAFVMHPNRILSRDQIMDKIYDRNWEPMDRAVDVLVAKLRNKIEQDSKRPELIKTIRGSGYMMTAKVEFSVAAD